MRDKQSSSFGKVLKELRRRSKESLAEVSGAVEIDVMVLSDIEDGKQMPTEDVLLLLISHFSLREEEASKLWHLAGFDKTEPAAEMVATEPLPFSVSDNRILYTDMVHVNANNYGVIINFLQGLGSDGKPAAIARVGMSREHARSIIEVLERTLALSDDKKKAQKKTQDKRGK